MKTCISDKTSKAHLDRICEKNSTLCGKLNITSCFQSLNADELVLAESLPSPDWDPPFDDGHVFMDEIMCSVAAKLDDTGNLVIASDMYH